MKKIIIGIDPGKGGALAIYDEYTDKYNAYNCPDTIKGMVELTKEWSNKSSSVIAYLEKVHAFPTDGRSSAFKFGMNYGIWQGILESLDVDTVLVSPIIWQKTFGKLPKDKQERKRRMRDIASGISGLKATLKTADAILICKYGYDNER
ncbi:MAG: hypothetical protein H8E55_29325 [Pelagibacterales bacterium]|nr:hypothetical protein [Pelagibacterales bacterium]